MKDIASLLDEPETTVAIVGATDNPGKYGYVIYRDLKRKGYKVYPVNPKRTEVDGDPAFPSLEKLPVQPTIVNLVVPPEITMRILKQCKQLGLTNVWLQPGADSPENLEYLQQEGFNYLANACIMILSRLSSSQQA